MFSKVYKKLCLILKILKQVLQFNGQKVKVSLLNYLGFFFKCILTFLFFSFLAIRLKCFVIVGYPQKKDQLCYNSLCCVNPEGKLITTYQKTFLYETDENWAIEGPGFVSFQVDRLGKVML